MSELSDAVETAVAVLEWERERNPDLDSRELAQRLINQVVASGCLAPASEVERLREAIRVEAADFRVCGYGFMADRIERAVSLDTSDEGDTVRSPQ